VEVCPGLRRSGLPAAAALESCGSGMHQSGPRSWQRQNLTRALAALNSGRKVQAAEAKPRLCRREAKKLASRPWWRPAAISTHAQADPGDVEATAIGWLRSVRIATEITARLKETAADDLPQRLWALRYRWSPPIRWSSAAGGLNGWPPPIPSPPAGRRRIARLLRPPISRCGRVVQRQRPLSRVQPAALQNIGGQETTAALVIVVADPEPNVRAAVLKQLEEKPT